MPSKGRPTRVRKVTAVYELTEEGWVGSVPEVNMPNLVVTGEDLDVVERHLRKAIRKTFGFSVVIVDQVN